MFLQNSAASTAILDQPQPKKTKVSQDSNRQLENLDFRLRQLEGEKYCFFLDEDKVPTLVTGLRTAEARYKARAPPKGQPHQDLNKKSTLFAALLLWTAEQDYETLDGSAKAEATRQNAVLGLLGKPTLAVQLEALGKIVTFYQTPQQLEREVGSCAFFAAKKNPKKLVLTFNVLAASPLSQVVPLLVFALEAAGGERSSGAPPKSGLFK